MTTKEIAAELRQLDGAMCGAVCHMPNLAKLADRIEAEEGGGHMCKAKRRVKFLEGLLRATTDTDHYPAFYSDPDLARRGTFLRGVIAERDRLRILAGLDKPEQAKQEATRVWRCEEAGHLWGAEYDRGHCPKCGGRLVPGTFVPISAG